MDPHLDPQSKENLLQELFVNIFAQYRLKYGEFSVSSENGQEEVDSEKKHGRRKFIRKVLSSINNMCTYIHCITFS